MSIQRNLTLVGIATAIQKVVLAGRHLAVVPFYISSWGVQTYGDWLTISAIPAAMTFANMGIGTAAANAFVIAHASDDLDEAGQCMRDGLTLLSIIVAAGLVVAIASCIAIFLFAPFLMPPPSIMITAACFTLALDTLIGFYAPLNEAWFRAARKPHLCTHITTAFSVVSIALTILLLKLGAGMLSIASLQIAITVISTILLHLAGRRLSPNVTFRNSHVELARLRITFLKGMSYMMSPTRQVINIQGTLLITRACLGAESAALLGTLRTLANSIGQVYNAVYATIFPELQVALASGRHEDARKLYLFGLGISSLTAALGCAGLLLLGPWVYHQWTRGLLQPSNTEWLLLTLSIFFNAIWWVPAGVFRAANKPEKIGIVGIGAAVTGVVLSAILMPHTGLSGAIAGVLLMEFFMASYTLPESCKLIGLPLTKLPLRIWMTFRFLPRNFSIL